MKKFWEFRNAVSSNGTELVIDGVVASETWFGDEVTPEEFRNELRKHSGDLTVVINSPGGDVFAGLSIYNALREHNGTITVRVDGLAASIASIIAMAGDHIAMSPGTQMMIHKPSVLVAGNADDLDKAKSVLEAIEDGMVPIYMARTGLSREKISEMLEAETWMLPGEAVELGFADEALAPVEKSEKPDPMESVQNLLSRAVALSKSATLQSVASFVNKMSTEELAEPEQSDEEAPAETEQPTEPAEPEAAAPESAETTEPEAETPDEEVEPEETEVIEPTEEDETMGATTAQLEIAKDQVMAPNPAMVEGTPKAENYLDTPKALEDFARILMENAGQEAKAVRSAWENHLKVEMGITNPEKLFPTPVVEEIKSAFKAGGKIWNLVERTGLDAYNTAWDTEGGQSSGHKPGTDKVETSITIENRIMEGQYIYEYLTLDKETIRKNQSTNSIIKYVMKKLPRKIIATVERAIVIGDGRNDSGDDQKIKSFISIKADAKANNFFAKTYTPASSTESRRTSILKAMDLLDVEGDVYIICKRGYMTALKDERGTDGHPLYAPGTTNMLEDLEIAGKISPQWFNDTNDSENDAYLVVLSDYKVVGDDNIESYTNFALKQNKHEYLQEIFAGGGLSSEGVAAVAIKHVG